MYDVVDDIMKVWPEATRVALSTHDVFRHRTETLAHCYEYVVQILDGPKLIELTARDSFDDGLAAFLLDNVNGQELPAPGSSKVRVYSRTFPKPWPFGCVVVVPPKIAKRFEHESPRLKRVTYWVLPAFAWEFRDGEGAESFGHQIYRRDGWNVSVVNWNRSRKTEPVWDQG